MCLLAKVLITSIIKSEVILENPPPSFILYLNVSFDLPLSRVPAVWLAMLPL